MNYNMKKCGEKLKLIQNRWKVVKHMDKSIERVLKRIFGKTKK